jgi:(2Fe-2S) ferredoxin
LNGLVDRARLTSIANSLSIGVAQRHIFLCADQTNPKCAPVEETVRLWTHLKARLKQLDVTSAPPGWQGDMGHDPEPIEPGTGSVLRSKVDCLRICEQGCIAVVYPEGTWYAGLDLDKLDRIIDEHLVGGRPVEEYVFAVGELTP